MEKLPSPLVMETVIVNNILEEMRIESAGLQSQMSSLNVKYLVLYNFKPLQKTVKAIT